MRAVGLRRFGGPEVLEVVELPEPEPGEGEVRVRVVAATVNPTDIATRNGARAEALKEFPPPWIPGMELAGEIDAVGAARPSLRSARETPTASSRPAACVAGF